MELSIIVINYNTFDLTSKCINSVISSLEDIEYELILVDNASKECSPLKFKDMFPSIILLPQSDNLGFAGGNNAGLSVATGDVILLLNSDTEILGKAINLAYNYLISRPKVGVVSSKLIYQTGQIQGCCQPFPSIKMELLELTRIQKFLGRWRAKIMMGFFFDHESEMEADWVWGTFFMIRKEIIAKFPDKRLPDDYFMYGEDMEWCFLIKRMGYKIMYYPAPVVIHHVSMSSSNKLNFNKMKLMRDNEFLFLKRYHSDLYARVIFILRSLNYLTLMRKERKFLALAGQYLQRAILMR